MLFKNAIIVTLMTMASASAETRFLSNVTKEEFLITEAAKKKFVADNMRLAAKRSHETLAYFKAHHEAGWL